MEGTASRSHSNSHCLGPCHQPLMRYCSLMNIIVARRDCMESAAVTGPCVCVSGIPGELFYVRHGIVNEYALSFSIPIKSDVTAIYFVWQSLHKSPLEPPVSSAHSKIIISLISVQHATSLAMLEDLTVSP